MTPEQQRIAIAEACPFVIWAENEYHVKYPLWVNPRVSCDWPVGFDPINDLNAMHEAEKVLRQNQFHFVDYYGNLFKVISGKSHYDGDIGYFGFELVNATASQRAEAFLRTIGRWIE